MAKKLRINEKGNLVDDKGQLYKGAGFTPHEQEGSVTMISARGTFDKDRLEDLAKLAEGKVDIVAEENGADAYRLTNKVTSFRSLGNVTIATRYQKAVLYSPPAKAATEAIVKQVKREAV